MAIKIIESQEVTWVNIDHVDEEAIAYLKNTYHFHPLDLEDIQTENIYPKIDTYKEYLFLILQFPYWHAETKKVIPIELDIFIGDKFLITIQHGKVKQMKDFFYRCMKNRSVKKEWMSQGPGYLLYNIIEGLFHQSRPILHNIGKQIAQLETTVFEDTPDTTVVLTLAVHRRNILSFRRIIDPQRYLLTNLSAIQKPFFNESMKLYIEDVNDYLSQLWAIIANYKDTIDGLHVTVESLLSRRTNKIISALTVISVSLLPLTLFSGIYGMNIMLPFSNSPHIIWSIFGALTCVIIGVVFLMKRRRWL